MDFANLTVHFLPLMKSLVELAVFFKLLSCCMMRLLRIGFDQFRYDLADKILFCSFLYSSDLISFLLLLLFLWIVTQLPYLHGDCWWCHWCFGVFLQPKVTCRPFWCMLFSTKVICFFFIHTLIKLLYYLRVCGIYHFQ